MRSCAQAPVQDGKRRTRWAVVRNTYGELLDTTWKTWSEWFKPGLFGTFNKSEFTFTLQADDVEAEILFRALDRPEHVSKLLSLELTGAWINEAREVPKAILDGVTGRVGRYPKKIADVAGDLTGNSSCTWCGVIMDTNPPDEDHWWYRLAEDEVPSGWRFFRQPGGLIRKNGKWVPNPAAENIANLNGGYDYYLRQLAGKSEEYITTYLGGQYGVVGTGRPVYPEYNDLIHASTTPLTAVPGVQLILSWDFGLTPAAVLLQPTARGRLLVLREWCAEDMGIRQFAEQVVKPDLTRAYPGFSVRSVGDPAGAQRAQNDSTRSCFIELSKLGIPTSPAPTNAFLPRREAVAWFLTSLVDGQGRLVIDPSCKRIRRGFLGKYFFERVKVSGDERFKDEPCKNLYSHPHDALQYGCLTARAGQGRIDQDQQRKPRPRPRRSGSRAGY
ncbi:hypothetical protein JCM15519_17010 [Fundidesulfovibrio butyratiphilus]